MKLPLILLAVASASAALPSVGPNYQRPNVAVPTAYRDTEGLSNWKTAAPSDALGRGEWWKLFNETELDALEIRALSANQDLRAAAARVEQARAVAGLSRSAYWPQISADPSVVRSRTSSTIENPYPDALTTTYSAPLNASWEIDLFGRVRRLNESARADAASSAATFEAVRLSLTAEVASTYFSLRALDQEIGLVNDTVGLRQRTLELVNARVKNGTAAELDQARGETELATTQADLAELENRRAAVQDALAVLIGEPASAFALSFKTNAVVVPALPAGLPSELLERRPDIAAAERALAAANARIGVAKAAFFPAISLTGSAGYASAEINQLFTADSRSWLIGPSLYLPIFQGGRNRANLQRSRGAYDEAIAKYRSQVLVAFREVQDALSATRFLNEQNEAQSRAVASAHRAAALAQVRYDAGYVSYLDVIDAQRTALETERAATQLGAQRLNTSVALIKALGGSWNNRPADRVAQVQAKEKQT